MKLRLGYLIPLIAAGLGAHAALAQYDLSWWTVDGGGQMFSTGGGYELGGTIGQPDASVTVMTGGTYSLSGGFWTATLPFPGDINCDGVVNFADINALIVALSGEAAYYAQYPNCNFLNADCNGDGIVNFADINAFIALLGG